MNFSGENTNNQKQNLTSPSSASKIANTNIDRGDSEDSGFGLDVNKNSTSQMNNIPVKNQVPTAEQPKNVASSPNPNNLTQTKQQKQN